MSDKIVELLLESAHFINTTCLTKVNTLAEPVFNCSRVCDELIHSCFTNCSDPESGQRVPSLASYCSNLSVYTAIERLKLKVFDISLTTDVDVGITLYGYLTPALFILVCCLNSVMVAILSSRKMRSPINMILCSIAIFDTLTIALPLPWYLQFYTFQGYTEYTSFGWCVFYKYFGVIFPTVCHNSSIWLTVVLSVLRYSGVCQPRFCKFPSSYKSVTICLVAILIVTLSIQTTVLVLEDVQPVRVTGKELFTTSGVKYVDTCSNVAKIDRSVYLRTVKAYLWVRIVFVELLPIGLLLVFNTLLLKKTYHSYIYRRHLVCGNKAMRRSDLQEVVRTTTMLVTLCVFCMVVEILVTVVLLLLTVQSIHSLNIFNIHEQKVCVAMVNFILFLSFPANFVICFGLSEKFRRALMKTIGKRKKSQSVSGGSTSMLTVRQSSTQDTQPWIPMVPLNS